MPTWHLTTIWLGPIPIQVWGLFVAFGFGVAIWLTVKRAPRFGIDSKHVVDFGALAIVASFIGARVVYVLEELPYFTERPFEVFAIWTGGLSSYGGFLGATIAAVWFLKRRRIPWRQFSDLLAVHLPLGWFIGRLGCYSIHDHAGIPCNGAFCVPFPDGTRRLDMGLIDGLGTLAVYPLLLWLGRRPRPPGLLIGVLATWYGLQRFLLDFLRAAPDVIAGTPKYSGLTLAQYLSLALFVFGIVIVWRAMRKTSAR
ncbi:prolipoprotein diacylglyceryl transferase [Candidatus Uhrbacteria bacterium]|nr:prolipoprotein diacylglyceryl transferase [Candidatus Uhrbacteria bacterium]